MSGSRKGQSLFLWLHLFFSMHRQKLFTVSSKISLYYHMRLLNQNSRLKITFHVRLFPCSCPIQTPGRYRISATCLSWTEEPSNLSLTLPISSVHRFNEHENICNFQPQIFQKPQPYCLFFPPSFCGTQKTVTEFNNCHVLAGSACACPQHQPHLSAWFSLLLSSLFSVSLSLPVSLSLCLTPSFFQN